MKFLTYENKKTGLISLGIQIDEQTIYDVTSASAAGQIQDVPTDLWALIQEGDDAVARLGQASKAPEAEAFFVNLQDAVFHPPVRPFKNVFCVGRNYREHIIEGNLANGRPPHQFPEAIEFFTKPPTALLRHGGSIPRREALTASLDYEVELAIVIGRRGIDIPEADALDYVFGYTIVNDVTARDLQKRHGQWFKGKSLDATCPIGPVITHRSAIANPNNLDLSLEVNGEVRQRHNTNDMIFSVQRIIAELSAGMTLEPGDIIATGTPQGVGFAMTPPRCLQVGDFVSARIEGIGALENRVVV